MLTIDKHTAPPPALIRWYHRDIYDTNINCKEGKPCTLAYYFENGTINFKIHLLYRRDLHVGKKTKHTHVFCLRQRSVISFRSPTQVE